LHEMLAGNRVFHGPSALDTQIAILNAEPRELPHPAINRLVRRCLEKDPEKRFPSVNDLIVDLKAILDGQPATDDAEGTPALLRRRSILQAGAGAVSLAALAGVWPRLPARWRNAISRPGAPRITRLAVLPLANLSGDIQQEYFADGMTDLLITDLGQIGALRVISRPSVMQFKGTKRPVAEIAKQLGVEALIVGSVQSSGNRVRITAQLVDAVTDQQLWTRAYERELTDVLTLQGEVARAISDEVRAQVTGEEAGRLSRHNKIVPAALDAYLLAWFYWD